MKELNMSKYAGKSVTLAFTGGLDSSYLLDRLIAVGAKITLLRMSSITFGHPNNRKIEDMHFKELRGPFKKVTLDICPDYSTQLIFPTQLINVISNAYKVCVEQDYLMLGVVNGDEAMLYIDCLKQLWDAYKFFVDDSSKLAELTMPLTKYHKSYMVNDILNEPSKYPHSIESSWCAMPVGTYGDHYVDCGECTSCKAMVGLGLVSRNDKAFIEAISSNRYGYKFSVEGNLLKYEYLRPSYDEDTVIAWNKTTATIKTYNPEKYKRFVGGEGIRKEFYSVHPKGLDLLLGKIREERSMMVSG